eukprot:TRINITY_DN4231_c0_g1_i1.p1 TRINITY_DN4231_c0_g1~~TRINITY_DN4231_c0_g1_i1.p1  ORF type:complete len:185 (-),score=12.88 TRINITY_DN4231_c0_g1_i1:113-667(-)
MSKSLYDILAYAAAGPHIQFFALRPTSNHSELIPISDRLVVTLPDHKKLITLAFFNVVDKLEDLSADKYQSKHVDHVEINLHISPIGREIEPRSTSELYDAICAVLSFLVEFHKEGLVHRDLRWPNILYCEDNKKWFVIDFELAAEENRIKPGQSKKYKKKHDLISVCLMISEQIRICLNLSDN